MINLCFFAWFPLWGEHSAPWLAGFVALVEVVEELVVVVEVLVAELAQRVALELGQVFTARRQQARHRPPAYRVRRVRRDRGGLKARDPRRATSRVLTDRTKLIKRKSPVCIFFLGEVEKSV